MRLEGGHESGSVETGKGASGGNAGRDRVRPPDSGKGMEREGRFGKMVGSRDGDENPTSRAEEEGKKVPRTRLFPRE